MQKRNIFISVILAIVVVLGVGFYIQSDGEAGTIKIGIMAPLSAEYAVAGENYQKGILLAEELYLKAHPDKKISIVIEDDAFNVNKGVSAYKKLMGLDKVDSILMLSTPVIDAIYPEVIKTTIPVMQLGIQTQGVAPDNIFQMSPMPEAPIKSLAKYINANYKFKKVAVLHDNTVGGLSFYEAFKTNYSGEFEGLTIISKDDLRSYATKIVHEGYDGVVFLTSPENGALTVKQILTLTKNHPFFIFDAQLQTGFEDYKRILGDSKILDGSISVWLKSGDASKFQEEYKKKYNAEPGFLADFGYDTFNVLINAYDENDLTWQENIQKTDAPGISGSISFDDNGVRVQDIMINQVKEGVIIPLD
jgi:branched-chain amino acid transport system substrate-binding protein